jgi:hypothetical protein
MKKPIFGMSSYSKNFPNWRNGKGDIFHEKHPQYPFYSLPFKGNSQYKQSFTEEQMLKLREHQNLIRKIGNSSNNIGLAQYQPLPFESKTTNQKTYKGFKLTGKPEVQTQKVDPVLSRSIP